MRATLGLAPIHTQIWSECSNLWSPHLKPKHPPGRLWEQASRRAGAQRTARPEIQTQAGKQVRLRLPLLRRSPARCAMHAVDQLCDLRVVRRSAESSWREITRARDVQDLRRATKEIRAKRAMLPQRRHKALRIVVRTLTDRQTGTLQIYHSAEGCFRTLPIIQWELISSVDGSTGRFTHHLG